MPAGSGRCRAVRLGKVHPVAGCCRLPAAAGCRPVPVAGKSRPVPGRTSREGAPGGRPLPVAGRCRWPAGAGCQPVPACAGPIPRLKFHWCENFLISSSDHCTHSKVNLKFHGGEKFDIFLPLYTQRTM